MPSRLLALYLRRYAVTNLLALLAVGLPVVLWRIDSPLIRNTYGEQHELIELFGLTVAVFWLAQWGLWWRRGRRGDSAEKWLLPLVLTVVGMAALTLIVEYSAPSWDYNCYEAAAQALLRGGNPYVDTPDRCYLYPPLLMQLLAGAFTLLPTAPRAPQAEV